MNYDNWSSAAGEAFESGYLSSELEEFEDDSVYFLDRTTLSLAERNRYCDESLDWERAPALPISDWNEPRWTPIDASNLSDAEVSAELLKVATRLYSLRHAIQRADHLSDRRLYNLILSRVLPCKVKRMKKTRGLCYWDFCAFTENWRAPATEETEDFVELTYYASDEERREWAQENGRALPPKLTPKHRRDYFPFNASCDGAT